MWPMESISRHPEHDREQHHRDERLDRVLLDPDQATQPSRPEDYTIIPGAARAAGVARLVAWPAMSASNGGARRRSAAPRGIGRRLKARSVIDPRPPYAVSLTWDVRSNE